MEIFIRVSSLVLVIVMLWNFESATSAFFPDGKNEAHLEKFICKTFPKSKIARYRCMVKYIDRKNIKVDIWSNLSKPISNVWVHGVIYYKYNIYQKIATEYWDNICEWLGGKRSSFMLDFLRPIAQKYTNIYHPCPLSGFIYIKVDNISVQNFVLPQIVPAGRYRIDVNITEGQHGAALIAASVYGSISDHRVEVVKK